MRTMFGSRWCLIPVVILGVVALTACQRLVAREVMATSTVVSVTTHDELQSWKALEQRPLRLATLTAGTSCPSPSSKKVAGGFQVTGAGPIYLVQLGPIRYGNAKPLDGWHYVKAPWLSAPDYGGPALIRGRQIDGPAELRFQRGGPSSTGGLPLLHFPIHTGVSSPDLQPGWRFQTAALGFTAPGCYGLQIDGTSFTEIIVIEARD